MRHTLTLTAIALLISAAPALASDDGAHCLAGPGAKAWMSQEAVRARLANLGFDVRHVRPEDGCYKVKAYDRIGNRAEFYVDPATAELLDTAHRSGS
jgi:hypothetical protein